VDLLRRDAATPATTLEARDARITVNRNGGAATTTGTYEEREKGFEPSTLALAIRCLADPLSAESVQERPNACNLEDLVNLKARPTVQDRPETSAESRPALHQTTTPGTLPFWLLKAGELSVLLTVREVADRLKVSRATVYGLVRRGELASVRVSNTIRVPRDAVEALVI
jgi:excisionase family DNA binding protein